MITSNEGWHPYADECYEADTSGSTGSQCLAIRQFSWPSGDYILYSVMFSEAGGHIFSSNYSEIQTFQGLWL